MIRLIDERVMKPLQALLTLFACLFLPLNAASLDDLTYTTNNGEVAITDCRTTANLKHCVSVEIEDHQIRLTGAPQHF